MRQFFEVVGIEFMQNLPMFVGFVIAVRLWPRDRSVTVGVLFVSAALTSLAIYLSESMIASRAGQIVQPTFGHLLVTAAIFFFFSMLSVFYFTLLNPRFSWITDSLFAAALGALITLSQSAWTTMWVNALGHLAAMTAAILVGLLAFRFLIRLPRWRLAIAATLGVTLVASLLITVIDYAPYLQI